MDKKLYRDEYHKVLGGVCSGLAEYFEMDPTIVRLLFAFTFFLMGIGLGTYIILWIVLPRKDYNYNNFNNPTVDYTVPPQQSGSEFNAPPPPAGNPFANRSFGGTPYASNPFGGAPIKNMPPKPKSHAGMIVGLVLIFLGAAILIDEFDLIPDFDFWRIWPVILLIVGGALIVSGQKKQPWDKPDWQTKSEKDEPSTAVMPTADIPPSADYPSKGGPSTGISSTDNPSTL